MNKLNRVRRAFQNTLRWLRRFTSRKASSQIATLGINTIESQPDFDMSMNYRILFGPINTAGAAFGWARAARAIPNVDAKCLEVLRNSKSKFGFKADIEMGPEISPEILASWKKQLYLRATHVVLESGFNITEDFFVRDLQNEINLLRAHSIEVALLFHGSDIRQPELHAATVKDSYWNNEGGAYWDTVKAKAAENRSVAETFDGPVLASTPGLVPHVPGGRWLPLSIDASQYTSDAAGNYGMFQLEAMAAGRLVLGSVNLALETVPDLPTVHVDSTTLENTLRSVLADRPKYRQIASKGPDFVERYHSGKYAADVLKLAWDLEVNDLGSS